jgi:periplasmic mercuric ion binding protein
MEKPMKLRGMLVLTSLCSFLAAAGMARAETKVELKGVHLCCGACVKAANDILKQVDGVKGTCDRAKKTITITATDGATAQKALDALAAGGFYGDTDNKELAIKDDSGATAGKVKKATVSGIHNCCPSCTSGIKKAVKAVDGVTDNNIKPKETTFEVTGDFDAADLVKALNKAGFHVKVEK